MRQQPFEAEHQALWGEYLALLAGLEARGKTAGQTATPAADRFPELYRQVCAHYALSRARGYSPNLVGHLHDLARRGYRQLYRRRPRLLAAALAFMASDFPLTLRRHARLFWLAMGLLFLPMIGMGLAVYADTEIIHSLIASEQVAEMESLYDPANRKPGRALERQADGDFAMFGFYIMNNIGIGFRGFASGLLFGLGSAIILIFNGLHIGAVAGHVTRLEFGGTFWPFVSGHGPYELTAIAISGAAGLLLGKALIAPGNRSRLAALRCNARDAIVLVGGAAILLLLAAVVEAFWSAAPASAGLKYGVGVMGWVLIASYLLLAGRGARET